MKRGIESQIKKIDSEDNLHREKLRQSLKSSGDTIAEPRPQGKKPLPRLSPIKAKDGRVISIRAQRKSRREQNA